MGCGKPDCGCKADPPTLRGPYPQWSPKVDGKTVTKLFTPEQLDRYGDSFDNDRKLKDLAAQLETLSIDTISEAEGWNHQERRDVTDSAPPEYREPRYGSHECTCR